VEVPFGAAATVYLPGEAARHRVRHGHHHWEVTDPTPPPRPVRRVRDVFDDPELWAVVTAAAAELGIPHSTAAHRTAADPVAVAERLGHYLDRPVGELPEALAPSFLPGADQLQAQLAKRIDEHLVCRTEVAQ
jgi:hypothetical protein